MDKKKIIDCLPPELQAYGEMLVDEIEFTHKHLQRLKKVDLILINKKDPTLQKVTPAGKQYHDYLQTLQNLISTLLKLLRSNEDESGETASTLQLIEEIREMYFGTSSK